MARLDTSCIVNTNFHPCKLAQRNFFVLRAIQWNEQLLVGLSNNQKDIYLIYLWHREEWRPIRDLKSLVTTRCVNKYPEFSIILLKLNNIFAISHHTYTFTLRICFYYTCSFEKWIAFNFFDTSSKMENTTYICVKYTRIQKY